jgi:hypothetical protein
VDLKSRFAKDKYILIIKPEESIPQEEGGMLNILMEKI